MNGNNKVPSAAGTAKDGNAEGRNCPEATSHHLSIPCHAPNVNRILALIPFEHARAVHRLDLAKYTGMHERDIRRIIERARAAGAFILSDDMGYWQANTGTEEGAAEIMRFYRREGGRIRALARRLDPVRQRVEAARAVGDGQIKMDEWGG